MIVRYGAGWRGLKPKLAYEHGAIGCIIYSDPQDDGYWRGDAYPKGGWRPLAGVQRGSVQKMEVYPGDPLTPGVGATKNAKRLPLDQVKDILKIPVLPISAADATPMLEALGGPVAPPGWRGALPFTYHVGPGAAKVHLAIKSDWTQKPVYDVIATIRGSVHPDQWVIRGNHHDGWVFGAWDPLAGNVALLDEAKAIGSLLKTGWRPKRTLIYASWDGEEPGLIGSTEWTEEHAADLQKHAVLYVNSDTNAPRFPRGRRQPLDAGAREQVAAGVTDPETGVIGARSACARGSRWTGTRRTRTPGTARSRSSRPPAPICRSRRSAPARTTAPSCSISASPRSAWNTAARTTTRGSITRATTPSITTSVSAIRSSRTA